MRVLLVSTYDLGRQPFGLASPAAWLRAAGAEVEVLDLAVQALDADKVMRAGLVAFHLPMHAATRLAVRAAAEVKRLNPLARLCFYGLYAVPNAALLRALGAVAVLGGEFEPGLVALWRRLAAGGDPGPRAPQVSLERLRFLVPDRSGLPPLGAYARLVAGGEELLVGATEATRGCLHLCRHCPVVPVYGGALRVVQREVVLEDVRRQVAAGARHVTFGDPDFLNGPRHALAIVRALHAEHPDVTYDVTVKVEHLLEHAGHLATLRETGCRFVTSAVESLDDAVLARLEKRHARADFLEVARRFRAEGLVLHPTFVAFHPWLTPGGYVEFLDTLEQLDLVGNVAPAQLSLRLLIPAGSRLLELEEVRALAGPFDREALVHPWRHPDPRVDALQRELEAVVRDGICRGEGREAIFARVRGAAWPLAGRGAAPRRAARPPKRAPVPYLSEPWYC